MPQKLLNEFRMLTQLQEYSGAGVPEGVQPHRVGETGTFQNRLEVAGGEVLGPHGLTDLVWEDEPVILVG